MSAEPRDRRQDVTAAIPGAGTARTDDTVILIGPRPGMERLLEALAYIRRCAETKEVRGGGPQP